MNRKISLSIGSLVIATAGVMFFFHGSLPDVTMVAPGNESSAGLNQPTEHGEAAKSPAKPTSRTRPDPAAVPVERTVLEEDWELQSHATLIARLQEYSAEYDAAFVPKIAAFFDHPEPAVRRAAVEAAVQLGEREMIPLLLQKSEELSDLRERLLFVEAAEYLELPTITELREQGLLPPRRADALRPEERTPPLRKRAF